MTEGNVVALFDECRDTESGSLASHFDLTHLSKRAAGLDLASLAMARVVPALFERCPSDPGDALRQARGGIRLAPRTVAAFAELLFDGFGSDCEDFAFGHFERTGDPQRVAAELLEPAALAVGRMWCDDTRDFLRVTYAASRLQRLFWRIARECPPPPSRPERYALLAPVPGEQHTFGLSIVEDALRRAGWEVDTCVAGEEGEMLRLVGANRYSFVGLSLGAADLLPGFRRAAADLRRRSLNKDLRIVAGGGLFRDRPSLGLEAGADHVCMNAAQAVDLAESFLAFAGARCQMPVAAE